MAPASHLVISHVHHQHDSEAVRRVAPVYAKASAPQVSPAPAEQIAD